MSCECTRQLVNSTTLAKLAPCEASAAPILANTAAHCPSKSAGVLPSLSRPTCPAMNRNSEALTREMFEYGAIGLARLSGLSIWILGTGASVGGAIGWGKRGRGGEFCCG